MSADPPGNAAGPALPSQAWPPRERIAFVLCHTREPGHLDPSADYCTDCLNQADRLLDDSEVANAMWCALSDVEDDQLERRPLSD